MSASEASRSFSHLPPSGDIQHTARDEHCSDATVGLGARDINEEFTSGRDVLADSFPTRAAPPESGGLGRAPCHEVHLAPSSSDAPAASSEHQGGAVTKDNKEQRCAMRSPSHANTRQGDKDKEVTCIRQSGRPPWENVLYKRQPYADNFVPDTFLEKLVTNGKCWSVELCRDTVSTLHLSAPVRVRSTHEHLIHDAVLDCIYRGGRQPVYRILQTCTGFIADMRYPS